MRACLGTVDEVIRCIAGRSACPFLAACSLFLPGSSHVLQALKHPEQAGPSPAVLAGLARPAEDAPAASRARLAAGTSQASAERRVQDPEPQESLVEEDLRSMAESVAVSAGPGHCTSLLSGRVQAHTAHGKLSCPFCWCSPGIIVWQVSATNF